MRKGKNRHMGKIVAVNLVPMMFALSCIIPIIWIFLASLKTMNEFTANPVALPANPNFDVYVKIFTESDLLINIGNSLFNTVVSVFFVLLIGFVNGYFFARFEFRFKNFLRGFYLLELLVPIHSILLPLYILFNELNLTNTRFTLIPVYICAGITTTTFLMQGYIQSVPRALEEAAAIDGGTFFQILMQIVFPLTKPIMATVGIIHMFYCWNEFSFALILLTKPQLYTISLALMEFKSRNRVNYPSMMGVMFVAMLPALVGYLCFNKQIIKGMVAGAVKG